MKSVVDTADAIRRGDVRAIDVLDTCRQLVEQFNPALNCLVFVDWRAADDAARAIDRLVSAGQDPGPLAGVPFGVKDLEDCAGMPTSHGSLTYKDSGPQLTDAPSIARLRAAGAIPIGKTAAAEFGFDSATRTLAWGVTRNPWNVARTPGGSSGGSAAAVAAGLLPFATATDSGGSTRSPAALTNLVGLKPTHGRIPRTTASSDTSSPGVLTTTVPDTARLLDVESGPDGGDRMSQALPALRYEEVIETWPTEGLRASWSPDLGYAPAEREVVEIAQAAARELIHAGVLFTDSTPHFADASAVWRPLHYTRFRHRLEEESIWPTRSGLLSEPARHVAARAEQYDFRSFLAAERARLVLERQVAEFFRDHDLLLTPTVACRAFPAEGPAPTVIDGRDASWTGVEPFTPLANLTWIPAVSIPAGFTSDGMPVGLQIMGRRHEDHVVLRIGRILEQLRPWPRLAPMARLPGEMRPAKA
jgi:Asp-tRNA(Asn)/Glu-tRNA(Gln) amidotransferase A subunit family amidase